MLRTLHHVSQVIVEKAHEHPRLALGVFALSVVGVVVLADSTGNVGSIAGLLSAAAGGAGGTAPLPGGPLPSGTTGLTSYLSNSFFSGLLDMASYFRSRGANINAEDLAAVILAESGARASVPNKSNGVCLGLNQICPKLDAAHDPDRTSGLRAVGFQGSLAEYSALSETQQLPFVRGYFDNVNQYKSMRDYGSLYLVNFSPKFIGQPDNFVMYRKGVDGQYGPNAGVDTGNKGYIEVADMAKFVARSVAGQSAKWNEMRMRLKQAAVGV